MRRVITGLDLHSWWKDFFFHQESVDERLGAVRITLCLITLIELRFGIDTYFYCDNADLLYAPGWPFFWFPKLGKEFATLQTLAIVAGILSLFGLFSSFSTFVFGVLYSIVHFYITSFSTPGFPENSHLGFFLIGVAIIDKRRNYTLDSLIFRIRDTPNSVKHRDSASWLLGFMQMYVLTIYLQAGLSKLIYGGISWFTTGDTILHFSILDGTEFGRFLGQYPFPFRILGILTGVLELFVPFLGFKRRYQKVFVVLAVTFHLGTWLILGISFWFLWTLYPALFLFRTSTRGNSYKDFP